MGTIIQDSAAKWANNNTGVSSLSTTINFANATVLGNSLYCLLIAYVDESTSPVPTPTIVPPSTPGFVWTLVADSGVSPQQLYSANHYIVSRAALYYIQSAASMGSAVNTTLQITTPTNATSLSVMGYLIEANGYGAVDASASATGLTANPSAGNLTVPNTDLVLAVASNFQVASVNAGSGFTLTPATTGGSWPYYGVAEYIANATPGTYPAYFNSLGVANTWGSVAAAFYGSGSTPILAVSPTALTFSALQSGSNPASQNVGISNGNGGTMNWTVASDSVWLSGSPASGTGAATVVASVNITGLAPGTYIGHLTITATGATGSPQTVTVTLNVLTSGGGGGGGTSCIPSYTSGAFVPDLSLYVQPCTALYETAVPTTSIAINESTVQGRNAIILDFNDSEGLYARDLGVVFTWPVNSGTILDICQPSIIPMDDDVYQRLSFHFLMKSLGGVGWQHAREMNIAYSSTTAITLLLTFDQWPAITITLPSSSGSEIKQKVTLPANKWKLIEGFISSASPFLLWQNDMELKVGTWGRTEGYKVLKPFS
jgi:hypothetical protein